MYLMKRGQCSIYESSSASAVSLISGEDKVVAEDSKMWTVLCGNVKEGEIPTNVVRLWSFNHKTWIYVVV